MSADLCPGEAAFHRLIKTFLPRREQGQTMGAYRKLWATEFANFQTVALYNELEQCKQDTEKLRGDMTLSDEFRPGQWWVEELEAITVRGTDNQKRAMAVVHNLLRQIEARGLNPESAE